MCEMNYMDELWDGWKLTILIQLAKWGEMNYMDELWDGWKLDHINTIGQMGWNELHGMNFETGWKWTSKMKSTTLGFRV